MMTATTKNFRFACGVALTANFILFWSIPIAFMGIIWKYGLRFILLPLFNVMDNNKISRQFAANYIYTNPRHADFFLTSLILVVNTVISFGGVLYWQITKGDLPWWMIAIYYFLWVGVGGRIMGAAYALAHKEGHNRGLYKKWIKDLIGQPFENVMGPLFGNVPWNFTTSHVAIHHRLDGGIGDTFYEWDLDRTSISEFMLYIYRIFLHTSGVSSMHFFKANNLRSKYDTLRTGVVAYWGAAAALLVLTRSPAFVFWIYFQPFLCMTYFLALINYGFHGFIEFDSQGNHINCVNSTTIIEGDDDYFGEDDHMAHHYHPGVYYHDLDEHQKTQIEEFIKHKASVFRGLSILELSIFILLSQWDMLAHHYVDYSGKMSKEEIIALLSRRAKLKETSYEAYEQYLEDPTLDAKKALLNSTHALYMASQTGEKNSHAAAAQ